MPSRILEDDTMADVALGRDLPLATSELAVSQQERQTLATQVHSNGVALEQAELESNRLRKEALRLGSKIVRLEKQLKEAQDAVDDADTNNKEFGRRYGEGLAD